MAALKKQLPELGHIGRAQLKIAPAIIVALGIGRPGRVVNTDRLKQFTAGESQRVGARPLSQDGGQ